MQTLSVILVLTVATNFGAAWSQSAPYSSSGIVSPPAFVPRISPPAPPTELRIEPPAPPVGPPGPPTAITPRACVNRHLRDGIFKEECVDISSKCAEKNCPTGTVCALDLDEELQCFPGSVRDFQNCGDEDFLLSQPCPQDSGIVGFGQGCNYCQGGNPFEDPQGRRLTVFPPSPPAGDRACIFIHVGDGEFDKRCIDISNECSAAACTSDQVCAMDHDRKVICFPKSVKDFENCGSEDFRLSQPCPQDSGIVAFGQGCTFCQGANPFSNFEGRRLTLLPPSPPAAEPEKACIFIFIGDGQFDKRCIDISSECAAAACSSDQVCGMDLDRKITCFPKSVKNFENCGSEDFRLSQPCPADAGIEGFGMGCTFCVGGNPFGAVLPPAPQPPAPLPLTADRRQESSRSPRLSGPGRADQNEITVNSVSPSRACVKIHLDGSKWKAECVDIASRCEEKKCPSDTVCGLNRQEQVECFPSSVQEFQNCGPEELRLSQPCPADAGIKGFGMGCTFCQGGNPFLQPEATTEEALPVGPTVPTGLTSGGAGPAGVARACMVTSPLGGQCMDIRPQCAQLGCTGDQACAIGTDGIFFCLQPSSDLFTNCGSEELRLSQPCPADAGVVGFGMGCTFCRGHAVSPRPSPAPTTAASSSDAHLACVSRITPSGQLRRGCMDLRQLCAARGCPSDRTCALDVDEQPNCFAPSQLPLGNCGSAVERMARPCPTGAEAVAFGTGCTYCQWTQPTNVPLLTAAGKLACPVIGAQRECIDISVLCSSISCRSGTRCVVVPDSGNVRCVSETQLPLSNCASDLERLDQPCPGTLRAVGFGQGCTYCAPP